MKFTYRIKLTASTLVVLSFCLMGYSQKTDHLKGHIETEVDPIAYALKGYSFHIGYQKNKFRYDAGIFGVEVPKSFSNNKGFTERAKGFGFKMDYLGSNVKGWFIGVETDYSFLNATYETNEHKETGQELGIGIRGGYRFMLGKATNENKGFYLVPWMGIDKIFYTSTPDFPETNYKKENIRIFPTIHFGWRF